MESKIPSYIHCKMQPWTFWCPVKTGCHFESHGTRDAGQTWTWCTRTPARSLKEIATGSIFHPTWSPAHPMRHDQSCQLGFLWADMLLPSWGTFVAANPKFHFLSSAHPMTWVFQVPPQRLGLPTRYHRSTKRLFPAQLHPRRWSKHLAKSALPDAQGECTDKWWPPNQSWQVVGT